MKYLPELHYFQDERSVAFDKSIDVTAGAVAQWCSFYSAELLEPVRGMEKSTVEGQLEDDKAKHVAGLLSWLRQYSKLPDLFRLHLHSESIAPKTEAMLYYPDDICCCMLNLSEAQFQTLQNAWEENGLPRDLFYEEVQAVCIPTKNTLANILRKIGIQSTQCYSPRRWEEKEKQKTRA